MTSTSLSMTCEGVTITTDASRRDEANPPRPTRSPERTSPCPWPRSSIRRR